MRRACSPRADRRTAACAALLFVLLCVGGGCARQPTSPADGASPSADAESVWQSGDITTTTGAPPAASSALAGYVFEAQGTQHVIYLRAPDFHIQELWWNINGWHTADLTERAGAEPADPATAIIGYVFAAQGSQHIVYTATDGHLQELWSDAEGWHHIDLTAETDTPPPAPGLGRLTGYSFDAQGTQHVVFTATDGHLYELWHDATGWHGGDVTAASGAPPPADATGTVAGYTFDAEGTQHVIFTATDGHLYELWSGRDGWQVNDLTTTAGAPAPAPDTPSVDGFDYPAQRTQHIVYIGQDRQVHELSADRSLGWHVADLSTAGPPVTARSVVGYAANKHRTEHVVFVGTDDRMYELWNERYWQRGDLNTATGAPLPGDGAPVGYVFEAQGTQHVAYLSVGDGHIRELWWGPRRTPAPGG